MKKIYLDFHGRKHSLYDNLIDYPPEGYEFVTGITPLSKFTKSASSISFLPNAIMKSVNQIVPVSILKPYLEKNSRLPPDVNMIYSSGHVIFKNIPWVVDLEFVTHLTGYSLNCFKYYKKLIKNTLESDNCKRIMPWTDAGMKTILLSFDSEKIFDKVETVHLAVPPKNFIKNYDKEKIKLLFVGSQNLPRDFDIKGGKEVLEAFERLNRQYKNLELTVRSYVPEKIKSKYSKIHNIEIIDQIIPWNVLDEEFKTSDIFLYPSHHTPGLAILDAMSYELPVITTDVWGNSEMVKNEKNGFIIARSKRINYTAENLIPNWSSPKNLKIIKSDTDPDLVNALVEKTQILIENEILRRQMGKIGRQEIEIGEFSLERRNKKLNLIFDAAAGNAK